MLEVLNLKGQAQKDMSIVQRTRAITWRFAGRFVGSFCARPATKKIAT